MIMSTRSWKEESSVAEYMSIETHQDLKRWAGELKMPV